MMFRRFISTRPEFPVFDEKRFWIGISVGVAWSIVMYLFLQVIRAIFIYFFEFGIPYTAVGAARPLDLKLFSFYDFLLAFYSILFGCFQSKEFIFSKNRAFLQRNFNQKIILFNQRNIIWNTFFVSFKFLVVTTLVKMGPTDIWHFYHIGWWISILFILFLYIYLWQNLRRLFRKTIKSSLIALPFFSLMAFGISQINVVNPTTLNRIGLSYFKHYTQNIDIPNITFSNQLTKKNRVFRVSISHLENNVDSVQYDFQWFGDIKPDEIPMAIKEFQSSKPETIRNVLFASLAIDKDIKMKSIYPALDSIRSAKMFKIQFGGITKEDQERNIYYNYFKDGITVKMPPRNNFLRPVVQQLQKRPNISEHDLEKYIHPFDGLETVEDLKLFYTFSNEIKVLTNGQYFLNNRLITKDNLSKALEEEFRNNNPHFYINVDSEATYGSYFFAKHELKKALYSIRDEIALSKYSKAFKLLEHGQQKEIRAILPLIFSEAYNKDEKFLFDFFKKNELPN